MLDLRADEPSKVDDCANHHRHKQHHLNHPEALRNSWPIATGVIEADVRYVYRDGLDVTGVRRYVNAAEAALKLRAVRTKRRLVRLLALLPSQEGARVHKDR